MVLSKIFEAACQIPDEQDKQRLISQCIRFPELKNYSYIKIFI